MKVQHTGGPLTQEEVDNLPAGTKVVITWSGGNGPHEYTIHKRDYSGSFVKESNPNAGSYDGEIDFVGEKSPYTVVTLANPPLPDNKINYSMSIDTIIQNTVNEAIKESVLKVATSYNSPVEQYIRQALTSNSEQITALLDKAFENLLKGKDFQKEVENVMTKKLAQSLLSAIPAEVSSVIDKLQSKNPVLKQEIEVAVSKLIKKYEQ